MLSNRLYRFIGLYMRLGSYFGIVPVDWCPKTLTLIPSKRAAKRATINFLFQSVWCAFGLIRAASFYSLRNYEEFNTSTMHFFSTLVCLEAISIFAFQPTGCMNLGNALFFYLKHINSNFINFKNVFSLHK